MARKFTAGRPRERRADRRRLPRRARRRLVGSAGGRAALRLLGRGSRRGRRRARRRLPAPAAADGLSDGIRPAAGPRAAPRAAQEPPHGDRPDRPAPARVPLRGAPAGDRRRAARHRAATRSSTTSRSCRPGCTIDLDRQSREIVLDNLKRRCGARAGRRSSRDLRAEPADVRSRDFLERHDHRLEDVYRSGSWTRLRRDAGRATAPAADADVRSDVAARRSVG